MTGHKSIAFLVLLGAFGCSGSPQSASVTTSYADAIVSSDPQDNGDIETTVRAVHGDAILGQAIFQQADGTLRWTDAKGVEDAEPIGSFNLSPSPTDLNYMAHYRYATGAKTSASPFAAGVKAKAVPCKPTDDNPMCLDPTQEYCDFDGEYQCCTYIYCIGGFCQFKIVCAPIGF